MIRVSGPQALEIVDKTVSFRNGTAVCSKGGRVKFACVYKDGELLDEVLVSIFRNPHSYTGEDSAEISCHASAYIVSELLALLCKEGCRLANPGEFTQRAFINGKMDLTQAEAVADVISSSTEASHRVAFRQLKGGFSSELSELRARLLEMASLMELELDFSEEDVEFADRDRLCSLLDQVLDKIGRLRSSFRLGNAIKNGVPVAIVGAANAGKSTLLNSILGEQRAIVSDIAGTTRDTIEECLNVDGVLFRFVDTAGIRDSSSDSIESIGIQRSFDSVKKARIVLVVIDSAAPDYDSLESILQHVYFGQQRVVFVLNKSDIKAGNGLKCGINGANKNVTDINNNVSFTELKKIIKRYVLAASTGNINSKKADDDIESGGHWATETGNIGQERQSDTAFGRMAVAAESVGHWTTEKGNIDQERQSDEAFGRMAVAAESEIFNPGLQAADNQRTFGAMEMGNVEQGLQSDAASGRMTTTTEFGIINSESLAAIKPGTFGAEEMDNIEQGLQSDIVFGRIKQMKISAKTGEGVPELLAQLAAMEKSELSRASEESVLITNMRHYQALTLAGEELGKVRDGIEDGSPTDLVAEDLRSALSTLGSITGSITTSDVLNNIFKNFCIGK